MNAQALAAARRRSVMQLSFRNKVSQRAMALVHKTKSTSLVKSALRLLTISIDYNLLVSEALCTLGLCVIPALLFGEEERSQSTSMCSEPVWFGCMNDTRLTCRDFQSTQSSFSVRSISSASLHLLIVSCILCLVFHSSTTPLLVRNGPTSSRPSPFCCLA